MSKSVDPDETAHMSRLIWIYAVCKSLLLSAVAVISICMLNMLFSLKTLLLLLLLLLKSKIYLESFRFESEHSISYKITCAPSEDSDQPQPAHPCSLISVLARHSMGSQGLKHLQVDSEDSDQTAPMHRLISAFAGLTCNLVRNVC